MTTIRKVNVSEVQGYNPTLTLPAGTLVMINDGGTWKLRLHDGVTQSGADLVPTNVSTFNNDAGYVTQVPTAVSQLTNDSGFITNSAITNFITRKTVPVSSSGASGDMAGDLAFDSNYIYYCTANYAVTGHRVDNVHPPEGAGAPWQYTWVGYEADVQALIALGDLTGYTVMQSAHPMNTVTVVGMVALGGSLGIEFSGQIFYDGGNTLTFVSPDYVGPTDIWKRISWSADTW